MENSEEEEVNNKVCSECVKSNSKGKWQLRNN